ncbi:MAG: carbohydrate-binding family 9-like protein [Sandaracinaceae bacterium]|nr:carbohydrate-binding family 9-like protein [Sandaracinaceae bacterium]
MRKTTTTISIALLCGLFSTACVEQSNRMSEADRAQLARYRSTTAPHPQHPLDVDFEGKIHLLGYDLSAERATAGQPFTVTWHWKVDHKLDAGWKQFTHVATATGENRVNQDGTGWVRQHYAPSDWQAGEYIRDEQTIMVPEDWNSPATKLFIGFWSERRRLRIASGPNDGDNRVPALTIPTTARAGGAATTPTPANAVISTQSIKATTPITVDGRLDEPAWATAVQTGNLVETMTGAPAAFQASGKITWDANNLYVAFEVSDDFLKSTYTAHDEHLWEQDTVEVMVDPGNDGVNYFEIQVAPTGQVFETRYDSRRQPQPVGHLDWTSNVRQRVVLRGHVNDDDADQGYTVEMALPWTAFAAGTPPAGRPESGATWGINLYVMDARDDDAPQRFAAWSPPRVGDFHATNRFARVTFVDAAAAPATALGVAAPGVQVGAPAAAAAPAGQPNQVVPVVPRGVAAQIVERQFGGTNRNSAQMPSTAAPARGAATGP